MEIYGRVRRAVRVEGRSQRAVAREFGISRETVRKMLQYAVPPGYQRQQPIKRPKLGPWLGVDRRDSGRRQAETREAAAHGEADLRAAKGRARVHGRLHDREGLRARRDAAVAEMFVPLTHAPGEAQVDFGEALVVIAGVERKAHYLAMDLPHSDDCFVAAFPAETTEAFLEGHVRAFAYFGGVPTRILYDNTKIAVAQILGGEERQRTRAFSELQSHYLFADKFGRPAKGNDKGKVEGLVGYARRNFMVPIPARVELGRVERALGGTVPEAAAATAARTHRDHRRDASSATVPRCCRCQRRPMKPARRSPARVSSLSLVRYRGNDYSVPTAVRTPPGMGEGLRARGGDRLRQRGDCPAPTQL